MRRVRLRRCRFCGIPGFAFNSYSMATFGNFRNHCPYCGVSRIVTSKAIHRFLARLQNRIS